MTEHESALIAGCVKGDKASWDAFVNQYSSLVYHTIRKTFTAYHAEPNSDLVDDLFQEFFLGIVRDDFKKLRQFRGDEGCSLASWLRVVTSRLTIDFLRKEKSLRVETFNELAAKEGDRSDSLIEEAQIQNLSKALNDLTSKERIFIDLYYRRNLDPEEIARFLRVSVNAVYTQHSRLKAKLRELLAKSEFS